MSYSRLVKGLNRLTVLALSLIVAHPETDGDEIVSRPPATPTRRRIFFSKLGVENRMTVGKG